MVGLAVAVNLKTALSVARAVARMLVAARD
jgi:hypothetical protein